jgi:branched-chain amino acid transport system ATP-binding protein
VGLIGPNGAGKTTLFNVVSGLQAADAGTISFDGRDVTRTSAARRAALGMGRSFQHLGLITTETVTINLLAAQFLGTRYRGRDLFLRPWRWSREERRAMGRVFTALEEFDLVAHAEERVADLSFGVARFVELACVLVEYPRLMMLDEPTTGLDLREIDHLLAVLRDQRSQGRTILVVAHDVRFVMDICDYVYVLSAGAILAEGLPRDIQSNPDVVSAYIGTAHATA